MPGISVTAAGIGGIFAFFGALMIYDATKVVDVINQSELNNGYTLVGIAVLMWFIAIIVRLFGGRYR